MSKTQTDRSYCPFYGFARRFKNLLIDEKNDRCGLIAESYIHCQMEILHARPDWYECVLNTEKERKKLKKDLKRVKVYPREFHDRKKSWRTLEEWVAHILGTSSLEK